MSRFSVLLLAFLLLGCGSLHSAVLPDDEMAPTRPVAQAIAAGSGEGRNPLPAASPPAAWDEMKPFSAERFPEIECGTSPSRMDEESRAVALQSRKEMDKRGQDYLVGPEDLLEISIFEWELREETKTSSFRVSETGYISLPVIGLVKVGGQTVADVRKKIEDTFRSGGYIPDPRISVDIREFRSNKVSVIGAVRNPGTYTLRQNVTTLLDILSLAGGLSEKAGYLANVIRPADASAEKRAASLSIDLYELINQGNLTINVVLSNGDIVNVQEAETFSVIGFVQRPGNFPMKRPTTVLESIAEAGGPLDKEAAPADALLHRRLPAGESVFSLDLEGIMRGQKPNCYLQPGDVIELPEVKTYAVMGFVRHPGTFALKRSSTVLEGIAKAGGLMGKEAASRGALLRRMLPTGASAVIPLDLEAIIKGERQNYRLRPGDVIEVPEDTVTYSVMGFVQKPGNYQLKRPMTVLEGIAEAGGLITKEAALKEAVLHRTLATGEAHLPLDLDAIMQGQGQNHYLQAGDRIEVPENVAKRYANGFLEFVKGVFSVVFSISK